MGLDCDMASTTAKAASTWHVSITRDRGDNSTLSFSMNIGEPVPDVSVLTPAAVKTLHGIKRTHSEISDIPTPPHSLSPTSQHSVAVDDTLPYYFDDERNSDFELIRVPKHRSYDLVRVPKTDPSERDQANVPLIATRYDGVSVVMYAKLDTGADTNFINLSTITKLLGDEKVKAAMYPLGEDEPTYNLVGANHIDFTHRIDLSFYAGKSNKFFESVSFVVYPDTDSSSTDGVPNVIIGIDTLQKEHMVMVDFEFHTDHDPTLEVISPKAESENPEFRTIGPVIKGPKRPGVKR